MAANLAEIRCVVDSVAGREARQNAREVVERAKTLRTVDGYIRQGSRWSGSRLLGLSAGIFFMDAESAQRYSQPESCPEYWFWRRGDAHQAGRSRAEDSGAEPGLPHHAPTGYGRLAG